MSSLSAEADPTIMFEGMSDSRLNRNMRAMLYNHQFVPPVENTVGCQRNGGQINGVFTKFP